MIRGTDSRGFGEKKMSIHMESFKEWEKYRYTYEHMKGLSSRSGSGTIVSTRIEQGREGFGGSDVWDRVRVSNLPEQ